MKRIFDLFFCIITLSIWLPFLLVLGTLVAIFLGRPVLFRQVRPGKNAAPFELIKFRSMTDERDSNGNLLPDDKRLTRFGRLLRASSLDELPEIINVLKGEMSLVGPRPLLMQYLSRYNPRQARRHEVRPGFTGWSQVNGRNALSWEEKLELDVFYVEHQTFFLDLKILGKTIRAVLLREGISAGGHETMPEFMGSAPADRMERSSR